MNSYSWSPDSFSYLYICLDVAQSRSPDRAGILQTLRQQKVADKGESGKCLPK